MPTNYEAITQRILDQLESGTAPWRKPWTSRPASNAVSNKAYRGINSLLLSFSNFTDNRWLTYKQAQDLGGNVRKGEKSTVIYFCQYVGKNKNEDEEAAKSGYSILKSYLIFNVSQCDSLTVSQGGKLPDYVSNSIGDGSAIVAAHSVLDTMADAPKVSHSSHAAYSPMFDTVLMPSAKDFHSENSYGLTYLHEMIHSVGHAKRLNRPSITNANSLFGSEDYSEEELVAEIGANMTASELGIQLDIENSAAYIDGWRKVLSADSKLILRAASQAQKATDYLLGREVVNY